MCGSIDWYTFVDMNCPVHVGVRRKVGEDAVSEKIQELGRDEMVWKQG
jgi:hypothetical protein